MAVTTSTIPGPGLTPSTEPVPAAPLPVAPPVVIRPGDVVYVLLEKGEIRPMTVAWIGDVAVRFRESATAGSWSTRKELRASGTIHCLPEDHSRAALRGEGFAPAAGLVQDPGRIWGRPSALNPVAFGEKLKPGTGVGEWVPRGGAL